MSYLTRGGINIDENYVKFKTNIDWYNMSDLVYLTLYEAIKAFLVKIEDQEFQSSAVVTQEFVDSIGGVGYVEQGMHESKEVANPFAGQGFVELIGVDDDGKLIFSDPIIDTKSTVYTVPEAEGTVYLDMIGTLKSLILQYDECEWEEYKGWWAKASQIVPYLWD